MKTGNLIMNWLLLSYVTFEKNYEGKGTSKIPIFKLFSELGKIWKRSLGFSNIPIFHLFLWIGENLEVCTAQDQHFKMHILNLWMNWEKLCPNESFSVKNKIGNSLKKDVHILNLTSNWDILFPKSLRIYHWIWKNIFYLGKWN